MTGGAPLVDSFVLILAFAGLLFSMEILFFVVCFRWLSHGKRTRERDFARLDDERAELLQVQAALKQDMAETKSLAEETLGKLRGLGAEAHSEWVEMRESLQTLATEFENTSKNVLNENLTAIAKHRMSLEKVCKNASECEVSLRERLRDVERVLRFLDRTAPAEQVMKEIQQEKYTEARHLLERGTDPVAISRKLGISFNEVALLSHLK